ncbi:unnamed protein product [Lepeophtheirus salmonis]|uniref:(salmon louse) hypothetical protein n=1 Tax=Lepeophtheirus salmonis TaxID=72036 RepID=A0A7R8CLS9_LEPSM|nr:unnamed protein product [Lepeophtheirus salmonis]CAF2860631.1 unnamed protein product [Lepeophtheirus salmonis]
MDIMDDDSVFKSPQKSFRIKRRILKEKQSNVTDNESLIKDLMPRDDDQELGSPFVDTVLKSPQRSFSLKKTCIEGRLLSHPLTKRSLQYTKGKFLLKTEDQLPQSSQENINMSIPGVSIDDSIANAPSKKKNTPITRRAIPSSNLPYEKPPSQ